MAALRWALIVAAAMCVAVVIWSRTVNGVALLALILAAAAAWTFPAVRELIAALMDPLPGVCFDCRDARHLSCTGACACPVDHDVERLIADVETRTSSL